MINESSQVQKAKRKLSYYFIGFFIVLLATSITNYNFKWMNEIMFGLILLSFIRMLYHKFNQQNIKNIFEIETHYDKLNSVLVGIIGIAAISFSAMNPDFLLKLNLQWINFTIFGLFFLFSAFKSHKSLRLIPKNTQEIEIEDYSLIINEEIKQIHLFNNKMILSKSTSENYEFDELNICEADKTKFMSWIQSSLPNLQIQVTWND